MKKKLTFLLSIAMMLSVSLTAFAQEEKTYEQELREIIEGLSPEQRDSLDKALEIYREFVDSYLKQQIHDIGGIPFGISREEALPMLRNKYGEPEYNPRSTILSFKDIKYAKKDFNNVHFLFESDGTNSFLNACIFVKSAKTKVEASAIMEDLKIQLEKRYDISSAEDENGFMTYGGGISPLWDGVVETLPDYLSGWHTDVIVYEQDLVEVLGYKYGVRLIYGPYSYIDEEF